MFSGLKIRDNLLSRAWKITSKFIEIIPKKYGKSNAIKVLQKDKKLPVKDVITVGDGLNDYNMVRGFDGYAIKGSVLSGLDKNLDVAVSVASLINKLRS